MPCPAVAWGTHALGPGGRGTGGSATEFQTLQDPDCGQHPPTPTASLPLTPPSASRHRLGVILSLSVSPKEKVKLSVWVRELVRSAWSAPRCGGRGPQEAGVGPACSQLQSFPAASWGSRAGPGETLGVGSGAGGSEGGPPGPPGPGLGVPCDEAAPGRLVDSAPRLAGQDAVRRPQLRAHAAAGPPGRLGHGHGRRPPGLACLRAARAGPRPGAPTLLRQGGRPAPEPGGLPALGTPRHRGPGPEWGAAGPRAIRLGAGGGWGRSRLQLDCLALWQKLQSSAAGVDSGPCSPAPRGVTCHTHSSQSPGARGRDPGHPGVAQSGGGGCLRGSPRRARAAGAGPRRAREQRVSGLGPHRWM